MAARRAHLRVTGRVQGVSYRVSTAERASSLDLTGWVRNLDDGAVELEAQGAPERVEALIEWCRTGPPGARVTEVSAASIDPRDGETGFRVR